MRIVFAKIAGISSWPNGSVVLTVDAPWDAADPFVKARPELFAEVPSFVHRTSGHVPGSLDAPVNERRRGGRG
jgi:hypothetical protein